MFSELIKLRELTRLARAGRSLEVLILARDPSIAEHKKAIEAVELARVALLEEASMWERRGKPDLALEGVRAVLSTGAEPKAQQMEARLKDLLSDRDAEARARSQEVDAARAQVLAGDFAGAARRLQSLSENDEEAASLLRSVEDRKAEAKKLRAALVAAVKSGSLDEAFSCFEDLRSVQPLVADLNDEVTLLLERITRGKDPASLARVLGEVRRLPGTADRGALDKAAALLVDLVEKGIRRGQEHEFAPYLQVFPVGSELDEKAAEIARGVRRLHRGRQALEQGDAQLAEVLAEECLKLLPKLASASELLDLVKKRQGEARPHLERARDSIAAGRLADAREALVKLLESQPGHPDGRDLMASLEKQQRNDLSELARAQSDIEAGRLNNARELLVGLAARRPDLADAPGLLLDCERRLKEQRLRAFSDESVLFSTPLGAGPGDSGIRPAIPATARVPAPPPRDATALEAGQPFVLRVEERGDWFVQPKDDVIIGNSMGKVADLPILAALGGRHARVRRVRKGDSVHYTIESAPGRRVLRNRRPLGPDEVVLHHGDVLDLGGVVPCTFLRPIPENETAVLLLDADFHVHSCARVLLFSEAGAKGGIVIGPGPQAHIPLPVDRDRIEILREAEGQGRLLARCPYGVALDDGPQRPQVVIARPGRVRTLDVDFFVDPIA